MSKTVNAPRQEQAATPANADPRAVPVALLHELANIDARIREAEAAAARQSTEAQVHEFLVKRDELVRRKEALPYLLRGARVRYLEGLVADFKAHAEAVGLPEAAAELAAATQAFDDAGAALERASTRLKAAERIHRERSHEHEGWIREANDASVDAARLAQGLEMTRPGRFDEPD